MGALETTYIVFGVGTTVGAGMLCLVYVLRHKNIRLADLLLNPAISKREKAIRQKHKEQEKLHAQAQMDIRQAIDKGELKTALDIMSEYKKDLAAVESKYAVKLGVKTVPQGINPNSRSPLPKGRG
jgi:predicted metal-dependent peptidase